MTNGFKNSLYSQALYESGGVMDRMQGSDQRMFARKFLESMGPGFGDSGEYEEDLEEGFGSAVAGFGQKLHKFGAAAKKIGASGASTSKFGSKIHSAASTIGQHASNIGRGITKIGNKVQRGWGGKKTGSFGYKGAAKSASTNQANHAARMAKSGSGWNQNSFQENDFEEGYEGIGLDRRPFESKEKAAARKRPKDFRGMNKDIKFDANTDTQKVKVNSRGHAPDRIGSSALRGPKQQSNLTGRSDAQVLSRPEKQKRDYTAMGKKGRGAVVKGKKYTDLQQKASKVGYGIKDAFNKHAGKVVAGVATAGATALGARAAIKGTRDSAGKAMFHAGMDKGAKAIGYKAGVGEHVKRMWKRSPGKLGLAAAGVGALGLAAASRNRQPQYEGFYEFAEATVTKRSKHEVNIGLKLPSGPKDTPGEYRSAYNYGSIPGKVIGGVAGGIGGGMMGAASGAPWGKPGMITGGILGGLAGAGVIGGVMGVHGGLSGMAGHHAGKYGKKITGDRVGGYLASAAPGMLLPGVFEPVSGMLGHYGGNKVIGVTKTKKRKSENFRESTSHDSRLSLPPTYCGASDTWSMFVESEPGVVREIISLSRTQLIQTAHQLSL